MHCHHSLEEGTFFGKLHWAFVPNIPSTFFYSPPILKNQQNKVTHFNSSTLTSLKRGKGWTLIQAETGSGPLWACGFTGIMMCEGKMVGSRHRKDMLLSGWELGLHSVRGACVAAWGGGEMHL